MNPIVVVSPHLDDAVFSVGQFLAGRSDAVVVTVFAGIPDPTWPLTAYDRKCGFDSSTDAVLTRRAEDAAALAILNATPVHLDFFDHQYQQSNSATAMIDAVAAVVAKVKPEYVLAPLGLLHPDHEMTTVVVLGGVSAPIVFYEELPYRVDHPEAVTAALEGLTGPQPAFIGTGPLERKLTAMWHYRSQVALIEFSNVHSMLVPERFWSI